MRRSLAVLSAALVFASVGCASNPSPSSAPPRTLDFIAADEIGRSGMSNAWEAINRLRPTWLRSRGIASISGGDSKDLMIVVYLDGYRMGDVNSLRMVSTSGIQSMQWLDAARAQTILTGLGSDAIAGAIVIKSH